MPSAARLRTMLAVLLTTAGTMLAVTSAHGAEIELKKAWARPMAKGFPVAAVYVDIHSDAPLKLVGATSPVAKSVGIIVAGPGPDGTTVGPKEVRDIDVAAGKDTRLALHGNYLELREIVADRGPGTTVPLKLEFVDPTGRKLSAETVAVVRGIALHPPPPAALPLTAKSAPLERKDGPAPIDAAPAAAK
jgi:periplasmic copper chaperone A